MSTNGTAGATQMPDLSGMIGALLSNPAAMSMLSSLLSGMGGGGGAQASGQAQPAFSAGPVSDASPPASEYPPPFPPPTPALPPHAAGGGALGTRDERAALLYALRPFLPPEKCEMIDGLLRILDLLVLIRKRR